ncbi:hypothetical protein [Microbacterium lacus]|uniref:hypothetical protein n=1 Tax=Microbacterium lacus TaxID=415217 RepID=UPI0012FD82BC|nr:hypothetical protein [Microbacterium lacus]
MTATASPPRTRRNALRWAAGLLTLICAFGAVPTAASAEVIGTGAVSIKGPGSELIPGVDVEIRKDDCSGAAVWRTTTTNRPDAYGAFGIGLAPGSYCVLTQAAPAPYSITAPVIFTMEARAGNWVTVWLPGPPPVVSGALVAKDITGGGVNGVTALIEQGTCASPAAAVWENTTATSRWSTGGFGISLETGTYCARATDVPFGFDAPAPVDFTVSTPGPIWVTLWLPDTVWSGTGTSEDIPVDFVGGSKIVEFSCPECSPEETTGFISNDEACCARFGVGREHTYVIGKGGVFAPHLKTLRIDADAAWTLKFLEMSRARVAGATTSGEGMDILVFPEGPSSVTLSFHGSGEHALWIVEPSLKAEDTSLKAEDIGLGSGDFWGQVTIPSPSVVHVYTTGTWQIDRQQ